MIKVVYAIQQFMTTLPNGVRASIPKGSHWPVDDAVVRANPDCFSDDPRYGMLYSTEPAGYDAPVETATAAPGERRSVRRGQ
jgi:hypothetical protein